ncbi:MAG: permease [Phycisphaeraceae bacterium]|nr:permease [Phycisphaeraceae bacterium]
MTNRIDILGIGCVAVDDLLYVASYPAADGKTPVLQRDRQCGGLVGTALVAAARLGAACAYAAPLGEHDLTAFALERLSAEGVNVEHVTRDSAAFPVHSVIVVGQDCGSRNIFHDLGGIAVDSLRVVDSLVDAAKVLMIDHFWPGRKLPAVRRARATGKAVVADFEGDADPAIRELLDLTDHLILSTGFASRWTGASDPKQAIERLWSSQRQVVAVTDGAKGCWYRIGDGMHHMPAFRVQAVDTTGCGDVFHGAYAAGIARGLGLEDSLRLASATSAIKATRRGGQQGIPYLNEVERFLYEHAANHG